jgi:hypothetical protein
MSVKTYTVATRNGPPVIRKGHIVTFTRAGHQPLPWRSTKHTEATTPTTLALAARSARLTKCAGSEKPSS